MGFSGLEEVKSNLRFCPICAWGMKDDPVRPLVKMCPNHGAIYRLIPVGNDEYEVAVDLAAD